jgi:hypothetical protein
MALSPCSFIPLADSPLLPSLIPFTYLETLLAVTGSVHLGLRLLVNWPPFPQPFPIPLHSKFPVPRLIMRLTTTTSRIRLLLSGTSPTTGSLLPFLPCDQRLYRWGLGQGLTDLCFSLQLRRPTKKSHGNMTQDTVLYLMSQSYNLPIWSYFTFRSV